MISLFLIAYIGAPLVLLFAEWPFGLVSKVVNRLNNMWVFKEGFSLYMLWSWFFLVGLWAFMLMYAPQVFAENTNPVLALYQSGHWLSWLGLLAVASVVGYFNVIKGLYAAAFVYSIHELAWIGFAGISYGQEALIYWHYWPVIAMMLGLLAGYFLAYRALPRRKEILVIAVVIVWDILWMAAGYHSSVANWFPNPKTPYFGSPVVNAIEILSWLVPSLVALL